MNSGYNTIIQVNSCLMGKGDDALGEILINNYFKVLIQENRMPKAVVFYNSGVKLLCVQTPTLESLEIMHQNGVKLLACKTCLNHFDLTNQLKTGIACTMVDIVEMQNAAEKIISL